MNGLLVEVPAAAAGIVVGVVLMAGSVLLLRRRGDLTARRLLIFWTTSWYLAGVAALTLPLQIRTGDYGNQVPWYDKVSIVPLITIDVTTFVLNIVMTVPLGLLLPLLTRVRGIGQVALTGLALSAAIELIQFLSDVFVSSGRTADINDLPANTLGAVLGYLAYRALSTMPTEQRRHPAPRWTPTSSD